MALLTVEGNYQGGKIELTEMPNGIGDATRVLVTFLPAKSPEAEESQTMPREAESSREDVVAHIQADLAEGLDPGGLPYPKREDLYDRREVQALGAADHRPVKLPTHGRGGLLPGVDLEDKELMDRLLSEP